MESTNARVREAWMAAASEFGAAMQAETNPKVARLYRPS